jgi:hypothetical protein
MMLAAWVLEVAVVSVAYGWVHVYVFSCLK